MEGTVLTVILCLFVFAIYNQYYEFDDIYYIVKQKRSRTKNACKRKVERCLRTPKNMIKWRICLIVSVIYLFVFYSIVSPVIPTSSDLILHFFTLYISLYIMFYTLNKTIFKEIYDYGIIQLYEI